MAKRTKIEFTDKELNDIATGIDCLEAMGEQKDFIDAVKSFDKAMKRAGMARKKEFNYDFVPGNITHGYNKKLKP